MKKIMLIVVSLALFLFAGCSGAPANEAGKKAPAVDGTVVEAFKVSEENSVTMLKLTDDMRIPEEGDHAYCDSIEWCGTKLDTRIYYFFNDGYPMEFSGEEKTKAESGSEDYCCRKLDCFKEQFGEPTSWKLCCDDKVQDIDIPSAEELIKEFLNYDLDSVNTFVSAYITYEVGPNEKSQNITARCDFFRYKDAPDEIVFRPSLIRPLP